MMKFKCSFCGREVRYESAEGCRSVGVKSKIRFGYIGKSLNLNGTFCCLTCLLDYIRNWYAQELVDVD